MFFYFLIILFLIIILFYICKNTINEKFKLPSIYKNNPNYIIRQWMPDDKIEAPIKQPPKNYNWNKKGQFEFSMIPPFRDGSKHKLFDEAKEECEDNISCTGISCPIWKCVLRNGTINPESPSISFMKSEWKTKGNLSEIKDTDKSIISAKKLKCLKNPFCKGITCDIIPKQIGQKNVKHLNCKTTDDTEKLVSGINFIKPSKWDSYEKSVILRENSDETPRTYEESQHYCLEDRLCTGISCEMLCRLGAGDLQPTEYNDIAFIKSEI